MWNLLKGVFRSLSKNKIAVIGLTFLIFISIGVYTVLTSCTTSIRTTYQNISNKSNLHDFTVNELYRTSDPPFVLVDDDNSENWSTGFSKDGPNGDDDNNKYVVPWAIVDSENGTRTYHFNLNYSDTKGDDSVVYQFWKEHKNETQFNDLLYPSLTIVGEPLSYWNNNTTPRHQSTKSYSEIESELVTSGEQNKIDGFIEEKKNELLNYINNNVEHPMQEEMDSLKSNGQIQDYRNFKALDITSSSDNVYYKIAESSPEDTIDKIYTFDNYKNIRNDNFSANLNPRSSRDLNPFKEIDNGYYNDLLLARSDDDKGVSDILHCPLPTSWSPNPTDSTWGSGGVYIKWIEAKLILLSLSDDVTGLSSVWSKIQAIVEALNPTNGQEPIHWDKWGATLQGDYNSFVNFAKNEVIYNKGFRFSIHWNESTTPCSWQYDLWVSKFAFVNPQYLKANNKKPLDKSLYENNKSYKTYKDNHGGNASLEDWLNSIPYTSASDTTININDATTFAHWYDLICQQYPQYTVANSNGEEGMQMPYIILGAGITANFIYPIVSLSRLVPNYKNECIIFTNTLGYQRINDSFRSSEVESYLVAKFNNGVDKSSILNTINDPNQPWRKEMMYPANIKIAYMYNDTSNVLSPAALRIAFIPILIDKLSLAEIILVIFILFLSLLICIFVINNYISKKQVEIGIMRANGVRRRKIVFSLVPFALLPSIIGGVIGYFVGFFLQIPVLSLFHNYWSVPSSLVGFNVWTLLISIFIPFLICLATSALTTIFLLRKSTVSLFKTDGSFKSNFISRNIKRPFSQISVISRFRLSLAFNYIWKLIVLSIMSALAMSAIVFSISINGKFDQAKNTTYNSQHYDYAVDLYSPTNQGGQYIAYDSNWIGQNGLVDSQTLEGTNFIPNALYDQPSSTGGTDTVDQSYQHVFGEEYDDDTDSSVPHYLSKNYYENLGQFNIFGSNRYMQAATMLYGNGDNDHEHPLKSFANVIYPNPCDGIGQSIDLNYLKNRSMTKMFLDMQVGFGASSTNPWNIATSLMPENNKNTSDYKTEELINFAGIRATENPAWEKYRDLFKSEMDENTHTEHFVLNTDNTHTVLGISKEFLEFEHQLYNPDVIFKQNTAANCDYNIQYNQIPLNDNDETYTYLSTTGVSNNIHDKDIKIMGVKQLNDGTISNKFVSLLDKNGKDISKLISVNPQNYSTYHPIIINTFAAKKHGLKVGDTLQVRIDNKADRFDKKLNSSTSNNNDVISFNIVGINQTFQNEEYFISQELANELLGLRNHLDTSTNVNNWYYNYEKADEGLNRLAALTGVGDGVKSTSQLYNFSTDYGNDKVDENALGVNLTPYGFNGVFTKAKNGGLLSNGFYLYSPSGLYPASDSIKSASFQHVLKWGANLEIANEMFFNARTSDEFNMVNNNLAKEIYNAYQNYLDNNKDESSWNNFVAKADDFITLISNTFGDSAYVQTISNVIDKNGRQSIYNGLSNTINTLEVVVLFCVTLLVSLIVILISNMLINNSQKLAAILKALGYSDRSNLQSFLAVYIPTIIIGLIIAIPISILLVFGFTNIIFSVGGILLTSSIQWWYYLVGIAGIMGLLSISGFIGYYQLINESLVTRLKTN